MATDPLAPIKDAFDAVRGQSKTLLAAAAIVAGFAASPDRLGKYDAAIAELQVVDRIQRPRTAADSALNASVEALPSAAFDRCGLSNSDTAETMKARIGRALNTRAEWIDSTGDSLGTLFILQDSRFQDDGTTVAEYRARLGGSLWTSCRKLVPLVGDSLDLGEWRARGVRRFALTFANDTFSLMPLPRGVTSPVPLFEVQTIDNPAFSLVTNLRKVQDSATGRTVGEQIFAVADSFEVYADERIIYADPERAPTLPPQDTTLPQVHQYVGTVVFPSVRRLAVLGIRVDTLTIADALDYLTVRRDAESDTVDLFGLRIGERLALLAGPIALFLVALVFWFHMRHLEAAVRKVDPSGRLPDDIRALAWLPMLGSRRLRILNAVIWTLLPVTATGALVVRGGLSVTPQRVVAMLVGLGAAALLAASMRILWRLAPPAH